MCPFHKPSDFRNLLIPPHIIPLIKRWFKMRLIWISTFLIVLLSSLVLADFATDLASFAPQIEGQVLPPSVKTVLANQKINIYIDDITVGITTDATMVKSISAEALSDPTIEITTTKAVVENIIASNNPNAAVQKALAQKEITYTAKGIVNKLKFLGMKIALKFSKQKYEGLKEIKDADCKTNPYALLFSKECASTLELAKQQKEAAEAAKAAEKQKEEKAKETPAENANAPAADTETAETAAPVEPEVVTHTVNLIESGFSVKTLEINVGEKVIFKNLRQTGTTTGMILGTRECSKMKSAILKSGETFEWTFDKAQKCQVVDGIFITQTLAITVN